MNRMMEFDKDKLDDALLKKIAKFTSNPSFTADAVGKVGRGQPEEGGGRGGGGGNEERHVHHLRSCSHA